MTHLCHFLYTSSICKEQAVGVCLLVILFFWLQKYVERKLNERTYSFVETKKQYALNTRTFLNRKQINKTKLFEKNRTYLFPNPKKLIPQPYAECRHCEKDEETTKHISLCLPRLGIEKKDAAAHGNRRLLTRQSVLNCFIREAVRLLSV